MLPISPGIRYIILAALWFAGMHALVKTLENFNVFEIVFFRSGVTALFCLILIYRQRIPIWGNQRKLLLLRSFLGIITMTLFFVTLQRMPMGASVSLKYLSPIFTAIFAVILLKEKVKWIQWVLFFTAFSGVFLLKGFDARIDTLSFVLGLTGSVAAGLVYVTIRRIGSADHPLVIINYFMLSAAILSGLAMIPFWVTPSLNELGLLLLMGSFGYLGQIYLTKAFQAEDASVVAPFRYLEVVYSLLIGLIWFGESYTLLSFIGIVLIVGSMLVNVFLKSRG